MTRSRRILIVGVVACLLGLTVFGSLVIRAARATNAAAPIVVNVGDLMQVAGTHVSCGVLRRSGANVIQCLAPPPLRGSYGTIMGDKRVLVVRFRNDTTAKVVFTAIQKRRSLACR
ncbi:MAG: hypothetical protein V7645_670 [Actinomycetota bacterium]|jgi:hypothetical protein